LLSNTVTKYSCQTEASEKMTWLIAVACLAVGIVIGVVFSSRLNSSPSRVQELENQIRDLKESHSGYRENVSDHFSMTADLVQHMTESYREVYQHLASGAQDLCSNEVAGKLLPAGSDAVFENSEEIETSSGLIPPRDYAAKQNPDQVGALSEEFGLDKSRAITDEELAPTTNNK
jgi:hypothetical protein